MIPNENKTFLIYSFQNQKQFGGNILGKIIQIIFSLFSALKDCTFVTIPLRTLCTSIKTNHGVIIDFNVDFQYVQHDHKLTKYEHSISLNTFIHKITHSNKQIYAQSQQ